MYGRTATSRNTVKAWASKHMTLTGQSCASNVIRFTTRAKNPASTKRSFSRMPCNGLSNTSGRRALSVSLEGFKICRVCNSTSNHFDEGRRICTPCRYKRKAINARETRASKGLKAPGQKPKQPWSPEAHAARAESARLRKETGLNKHQRELSGYRGNFKSDEAFAAAVALHKQLLARKCPNRAWRVMRNPDEAGIHV